MSPHSGSGLEDQPRRNHRNRGFDDDYRKLTFDREIYLSHRIIWMWMTGEDPGEMEVDHIDRDRFNNRWSNSASGHCQPELQQCRGPE